MSKKLFIIFVSFINSLFAQNTVVVDSAFKHLELSSDLIVAEDKTKLLKLNDALLLKYVPQKKGTPNFGFSNSSYWFRGVIANATNQWKTVVLEVANPNIDVVSLYTSSIKAGRHTKTIGDLVPFSKRGNTSRYYTFNLNLLANDTLQFVLNVQNSGEQFHVPISIGTSTYYQESDSNQQLIFGVYFGFILFVLFLNAFFYYVLKDKATLFYIGYLFCLLFLQLSLTGFGFKYFWPNSIFLANHANPIFASISIFFLLLFSQYFLNISTYLPKLNKWVNGLKVYLIIVAIAAWIDVNSIYIFSVLSINILSIVCIFVIVPTAIYILKQQFKPARFFIIAFLFLIISVFLFVLKNAGVVPSNDVTNYGLQIGSALEVLLLTLAVIDKFNEFRIDSVARLEEINELKTMANKELEKKVEERTLRINEQKITLESQNSEIKSSIRYAKRIQDSLLPPKQVLDELFFENYFVFYKPKDIVSGDFYWASPVKTSEEIPNKLSLAAVVDCTGHGVPGAFLSIVASNILKRSLTQKNVNTVAQALDYLNEKVVDTLNQTSSDETRIKDGMDLALIAVDYKNSKLYYSGANNPIYIFRKTDTETICHVLKATKKAVGTASSDKEQNFILETFDLKKGDTIYLFSDGYADQFGGEYDKKFNYKRFKALLEQAFEMPIQNQKAFIEKQFDEWMGNREQTDDVCVMGLKI